MAKAEVVKPIRPRIVEEKEDKEINEGEAVRDSEVDSKAESEGNLETELDGELAANSSGKRERFWRRIMEAKRNMKGTMVMTTAMATRML